MKKLNFLILYALVLLLLGCRTEDFADNNTESTQQLKVTYLKRQQFTTSSKLIQAVDKLILDKNKQELHNKNVKENNPLQDAIIGTHDVVMVTKGSKKTYTFPIFRTYLSEKTENLVLEENPDGTFSGMLIEYDIERGEIEKLLKTNLSALENKIKIFPVNDLHLNTASRTYTIYSGCISITYETGMCSADEHESGFDSKCMVGGAPPIKIIDIGNNPHCSGGDNGGSDGGGYTSPINISEGGYSTLPFVGIDYQYFQTEDLNDPNYVLYNKVAAFFGSQMASTEDNNIRQENPNLFYYAYFYFKENGFNNTTKAFITERLTKLTSWYKNANLVAWSVDNQIFFNWAYRHLIYENPDKTWDEFYDEFLSNPCETLKENSNNIKFQGKLDSIKTRVLSTTPNRDTSETMVTVDKEKGVLTYNISTITSQGNGLISVTGNTSNLSIAGMHNHPENSIPIFSYADIVTFYDTYKFLTPARQRVYKDYLVSYNGTTYALQMNDVTYLDSLFEGLNLGTVSTTEEEKEKARKRIQRIYDKNGLKGDHNFTQTEAEQKFLKSISDPSMGTGNSIHLFRRDGSSWGKLNIDSNGNVTKENCP